MEQLIESKIDIFLESISSPLYLIGIIIGISFIIYGGIKLYRTKSSFKFSNIVFILIGAISIISSALQIKYN